MSDLVKQIIADALAEAGVTKRHWIAGNAKNATSASNCEISSLKISPFHAMTSQSRAKTLPPLEATTSAKDILAHLNCAMKSILPGPLG